MASKDLQRQQRIIAGSPNAGDMLLLLELMRDDVNDIRSPIGIKGAEDSIAIRQAIHSVLTTHIDKVRALRENKKQQGRPRDTDDDDTLSMGDNDADSDLL